MNTMPQTFDAEPLTRAESSRADSRRADAPRAGFSVSAPVAARRAPASHLKLVTSPAAPEQAVPYDLSARRHLARVPERHDAPQAEARAADKRLQAPGGSRAKLEPVVFALVLLVSVAALAVGLGAH
jgi:hypothetical protein